MSRNNYFRALIKKLFATRKAATQKCILFVDDDICILDSLKEILLAHNYGVECARNAQEGLDLFKQGKFDLVITDYMMPGKNGIDLLVEIKKINSKIPVIIFTGYGTQALLNEAIELGAADLIVKGESIPSIIQLIERSLGQNDSAKK